VKRVVCVLALAVLFGPRFHAAPQPPPKLAVVFVVDQMRADYIERFSGAWTGGLKRMATQGAWYQRAAYPYLTTVTCAGHATVSTGSFPHVHGVFQNGWWDREARKQMTCTEDPNAKDVGYGVTVGGGNSAYRLQVPTFTDQMRTSRQAHVVSLALKDRSAIMLGGHGGDAITWLTNTMDAWETAAGYSEHGVPAVKGFVDANPIAADFGKTWERSLPPASYQGADDAAGEAPPQGWTRTFPHALKGTADKVDSTFYAQWERSPFADAYIGRFAAALVQSLQLGKHDGTDVLAVSFSSPDLVGHAFGPRSHEIQDMYAHLDKTIGTLLDQLDTLVGKDQWVAGLTADHGVTPIPEQLVAEGKDAGRVNGGALVDAVEQVLKPALGQGRHVTVLNTNDLYFEPGIYNKIIKSPELITSVISAIQSRPGIERAFRSEELRGGAGSKDRLLRAAALSYFPGRSGDIVFATKPGWMISSVGTTHGSANADDQHVPVLFYGRGVKAGKYQDAATPADLAPTLAAIAGLTMKAEGHALSCVQ
jgi:predicted AlkP superfamily pyrophosphatase or phosphodiesterase